MKLCYSEQLLPVPWPFFISRFDRITSPTQSKVIINYLHPQSLVCTGCPTFNLSPNCTHLASGKAVVFPAFTSDDQKYVCLHWLHSLRQ